MKITSTNTIKELFMQFNVRDSVDKYIYYLYALIVRSVFTNYQEEKSFKSYADAWESPMALAMREYFAPKDVDSQLIFRLAEQTDKITGLDFLQEIVPDLLPQNPESVFEYLEGERWQKNDRTLFYLLLKIWAVIQVQGRQTTKPYHVNASRLKAGDISALLFAEYKNWQKDFPKYTEIKNFGKKEFFKTWCLVYGNPFTPVPVTIKRKLSKLLELLVEKDCPEETILAYYFMARTGKRFKIKEIGSLWDYFQAVFSDKVANKEREQARSLGELFYQEKDIFEQCMAEWRDISPKDFLRALYYLGQRNASQVIEWENCAAFAKLRQTLQRYSHAVIVDANPDFIFHCLEEEPFAGKELLFVLPSKALAQIYEAEFSGKAKFAYTAIEKPQKKRPGRKRKVEPEQRTDKSGIEETKQVDFIGIQTDPIHRGREKIFLEEKIETKYEVGIIFTRQKSLWMLPSVLREFPKLLLENGILLFQAPQALINEGRYGVRDLLPQNSCREILLLPNNQESEWLKKQLLMSFCFCKEMETETQIKIWESFSIRFGEKETKRDAESKELICQEPWSISIPAREVFSGRKTIKHLWEEHRPKPEQKKSRGIKCYCFSKEIMIWYSFSETNYRGTFAFYEIPTSGQLRKNPLARGKRLTDFYPFRAKNTSEVEKKIRERIFQEPIKTIIQRTIWESYRGKPISLKSFWFCHLDSLRDKSAYKEAVMTELTSAPSLADILSTDAIPLEEYQQRMENDFGERGEGEKLLLWKQLNLLLNHGDHLKPRCFYPNPISSYVNVLTKKDLDYQKMRESLVKRSYTMEEELIILGKIKNALPQDGISLGAAISFYTGMFNHEICALNWDDCQSISGKLGKQFLVYKRVDPKGEIKPLGTEHRAAYRRIPIVGALWKLLKQRKDHVIKSLSTSLCREVSDEELKDLPIVTDDEINFEKRCTPARLKKAKDTVEKAAGIMPMEGSVIGGDQEEKSTDFNSYHGDRFRENFRQRTLQTCSMTVAEQCYLLGIALPDTFSRHYCDYINDFSQLKMLQTLERWAVLHEQRAPEDAYTTDLMGKRQVVRVMASRCNQRPCIDLDITVEPLKEETAQLILRIEDICGAEIDLYTIAVRGN